MLKSRIIPCLDVKDGRVVKGVNFVDLRDAGDPVESALAYDARRRRRTLLPRHHRQPREPRHHCSTSCAARRKPASCRSPSAAACARSTISALCCSPAPTRSRSITAAVADPAVRQARRRKIRRAVHRRRHRRQAGAARTAGRDGRFSPMAAGGRPASTRSVVRAKSGYGAGEILLTSMDRDGSKAGFDLELTRAIADASDDPRDRLRRRRHARPSRRRGQARPRQRRARGVDLPFRRIHDPSGQAENAGGWHRR